MLLEFLISIFIVLGLFFMLVAAVGVVRLESFYERIHAPTKAATLGLIFLLAAVVIRIPELSVAIKSLLALLFFAVTAPVGAHLLCRTAYRRGVRPKTPLRSDDIASRQQFRD